MSLAGTVQRSEQNRREEEIQAIQNGEVNTSGTRKDVYDGLRGKVIPMPEEKIVKENHERLSNTGLIAEADINQIDLTDIALWEDTNVINQQEADKEIPEAIEEYGTEYVVEETVENLLDEFTERGIVYEDPGDNIGFFNGQPKAFDVYDDSAFEIYDNRPENMPEAELHKFKNSAPVMYQKFACDVARYSGKEPEEVVNKVTENSEYLETGEASMADFQQAFNYSQ